MNSEMFREEMIHYQLLKDIHQLSELCIVFSFFLISSLHWCWHLQNIRFIISIHDSSHWAVITDESFKDNLRNKAR